MARPSSVKDRVADVIEERIRAGKDHRYQPGQWLPTADELGVEMGAHRTTVGRALQALAERGLVVVYTGKGAKVIIRTNPIVITASDILEGAGDWRGFPASVYRAGGEPFNDITSTGDVPASDDIATRLNIPPGTTVYERVRTQGEIKNGRRVPIQLSWSWYTMELANRVPAIRTTPATGPSPIRDSVAAAGYRVRYDVRAKARHPSQMERELLDLSGDIVYDIWRTCLKTDERPIEVSRLILDAEKVELAYSYSPPPE